MKLDKTIINEINNEFTRQDKLHGHDNRELDFNGWMLVLAEEYGEVAKEANELYFREGDECAFRREIIQLIAVAIRALKYKNGDDDSWSS